MIWYLWYYTYDTIHFYRYLWVLFLIFYFSNSLTHECVCDLLDFWQNLCQRWPLSMAHLRVFLLNAFRSQALSVSCRANGRLSHASLLRAQHAARPHTASFSQVFPHFVSPYRAHTLTCHWSYIWSPCSKSNRNHKCRKFRWTCVSYSSVCSFSCANNEFPCTYLPNI